MRASLFVFAIFGMLTTTANASECAFEHVPDAGPTEIARFNDDRSEILLSRRKGDKSSEFDRRTLPLELTDQVMKMHWRIYKPNDPAVPVPVVKLGKFLHIGLMVYEEKCQ